MYTTCKKVRAETLESESHSGLDRAERLAFVVGYLQLSHPAEVCHLDDLPLRHRKRCQHSRYLLPAEAVNDNLIWTRRVVYNFRDQLFTCGFVVTSGASLTET